jgi:hypothetical protein
LLRRSLSQQIIAEYLKLTGKDKRLGKFRTGIATGIGASLAEPLVAQFLNPETLLDFLNKRSVKNGAKCNCSLLRLFEVWKVWWHSEYELTRFHIYLPPDKAKNEQ